MAVVSVEPVNDFELQMCKLRELTDQKV